MVRHVTEDTIVVIGLGRFGAELATTLMALGKEVLAIEKDPDLVARMAPEITLAVEGDGTRIETLRSLGVDQVRTVVVGIGDHLEASLLATSALAELGVEHIWAKAISHEHRRILERVGATHVVFPELDMGNRVGHQLVHGEDTDYVEFANGYALSLVGTPPFLAGKSPSQVRLLTTRRVVCVAVQRQGDVDFQLVSPTTVLNAGDLIVVAGRAQKVEAFALGR